MSKRHNTAEHQKKWRIIRPLVLDAEPLCRLCAASGYTVGAVEVDHIVPLGKGGTSVRSNLQPLCRLCHEQKTMAENKRAIPIGDDGWPLVPVSAFGSGPGGASKVKHDR